MSLTDMDQDRYTVIVTGGSRGIGRAICLAFAGSKAQVVFTYNTSAQTASETIDMIQAAGGIGVARKAAADSEAEMSAVFDTVIEQAGRIDVLVNNAGITRDGLVLRMKEADWDRVLAVNLKGAFVCSKLAARTMIRQRSGRIVNIASVVGISGNAGQANYVASKAGLIGLTKAMARELASRGITVNAVAPGDVETDMTAAISESAKETILKQIPLGRAGRPQDVAAAVKFLASEESSYVTGHVLYVCGGMYM